MMVAQDVRVVTMMTRHEAEQATQEIKDKFVNIRAKLIEIEDREGYKALGYPSMRSYLLTEFDLGKSQLYRELQAGRIEREIMSPIGENRESHMRELAKLETPEERRTAALIAEDLSRMVTPNKPPKAGMYRVAVETVQEIKSTGGYVSIDGEQVHIASGSALNKYSEQLHRAKQHVVGAVQKKHGTTKEMIKFSGTLQKVCEQIAELTVKHGSGKLVRLLIYEIEQSPEGVK